MKIHLLAWLSAATVALTTLAPAASGAGFEHGYAADPNGEPLEVGIWYPSRDVPRRLTVGPTTMMVAPGGAIDGQALPLVVISHGTGGGFLSHADTAIALADAGYVVAAVTHTGDSYADQSRTLRVMDRPRHVSRVIDHLFSAWAGRARLAPDRVGLFGFSAGGFTALVAIGGVPDLSSVAPMCEQHPSDFACALIRQTGGPVEMPAVTRASDPRVRAAVVAAPALGFAFAPDGLAGVRIPVQLWRAERDTVLPHPRYAEAVRTAMRDAPEYHVVPGAGHFDFLAPCSDALRALAPAICASAPDFDRTAFHRAFNAEVVRFFDRTLAAR